MQFKKTKIICTIGPAVASVEKILELIKEGMDGARLNFSHGSREEHLQYINYIREAGTIANKMIAIIQDLSGPKIRVSKLENGFILLNLGDTVRIYSKERIGDQKGFSTTYSGLPSDVKLDEIILLDDGNLKLKVTDIDIAGEYCDCEVVIGGVLKENKGVNLPHTEIKLPSVTEKDLQDLEFGLQNNIDFVAMSFVRTADDIRLLKETLKSKNADVQVIAKIERPEAIENIDSIIEETDLIMVARGDLGVEISNEEVPLLQKMIIKKCNDKIKPVITATQMLESMITEPTPTRAEASDIANAILDGTDCVMLSAETSTGQYPVLAVSMMKKIILRTETIKPSFYHSEIFVEDSPENTIHTICNSASVIAARVNAKAILTMTRTGRSALLISNHRPGAQIISATNNDRMVRRFKLVWGVESIMIERTPRYGETMDIIKEKIISNNILTKGDRIVVVASIPFDNPEVANMINVSEI